MSSSQNPRTRSDCARTDQDTFTAVDRAHRHGAAAPISPRPAHDHRALRDTAFPGGPKLIMRSPRIPEGRQHSRPMRRLQMYGLIITVPHPSSVRRVALRDSQAGRRLRWLASTHRASHDRRLPGDGSLGVKRALGPCQC